MVDDNDTRVTTAPLEPPRLYALGEMAVIVAIEELGRGEEGGNNIGPDVWKYTRNPKSTGSWCAAFISWCFEEAARRLGLARLPFQRSNRAKTFYRNVGESGIFVPCQPALVLDGNTVAGLPEPGDVVCWHREGDLRPDGKGHVALVERFSDSVLYGIDGNGTSYAKSRGRVRRFTYEPDHPKMKLLVGYSRPPAR